jgi:hypothetical protein
MVLAQFGHKQKSGFEITGNYGPDKIRHKPEVRMNLVLAIDCRRSVA